MGIQCKIFSRRLKTPEDRDILQDEVNHWLAASPRPNEPILQQSTSGDGLITLTIVVSYYTPG